MAEINQSLVSELPGTILGEILSVTDQEISNFLNSIETPQAEGEIVLGNIPRLAAACFIIRKKIADAAIAEIDMNENSLTGISLIEEFDGKEMMFMQKNAFSNNQVEFADSLGWIIVRGAFKENVLPNVGYRKGGIIVGFSEKTSGGILKKISNYFFGGVIIVKTVTVTSNTASAEA